MVKFSFILIFAQEQLLSIMKFDFNILWTTKSNASASKCKHTFSENWLTIIIASTKIKKLLFDETT